MQTIMELKVQVLLNQVSRAAQELVQGAPNAATTMSRELSALQRLVGASITALRNAEAEDGARQQS